MIRPAYRPGLGAVDKSFCEALLSARFSYVPPTQSHRDSMIASCDAAGVDIRQAAGLLPTLFVDQGSNPYYTAYEEIAASTNVASGQHIPIPMNPDTPAQTTQQITELPVYQGSAAWNPPSPPQSTAPAAGSSNPPAAESGPPDPEPTVEVTTPGATPPADGDAPADGRQVIGGALVDEVISTLPPELQDLAQRFRQAAGALPWWTWLAAIAAAYYLVSRPRKPRRRRR